jgi:hypothetical protein
MPQMQGLKVWECPRQEGQDIRTKAPGTYEEISQRQEIRKYRAELFGLMVTKSEVWFDPERYQGRGKSMNIVDIF